MRYFIKLGKTSKKKVLSALIVAMVVIMFGASCTNELSRQPADQFPFLGIIGLFFTGSSEVEVDGFFCNTFTGNCPAIDGNGFDSGVLRVEVDDAFPDGSTIEYSFPELEPDSNGCVFDADQFIMDTRAFATVGGFLELDQQEFVIIAVEVTTPDGFSQSDRTIFVVNRANLTSPANQSMDVPFCPEELGVFIVLTFNALNIEDDTLITFEVSDPDLGFVTPDSAEVVDGSVTIQYTANNGFGGLQTISATIIMPNPVDLDPSCPDVPEEDRTITVTVLVTQSVNEEPMGGCLGPMI